MLDENIPVDDDAEQHRKDWKFSMIEAYGRFHEALEADRRRHPGLTAYAPVERAEDRECPRHSCMGLGRSQRNLRDHQLDQCME